MKLFGPAQIKKSLPIGGLLLLASSYVQAAEWSAEPSVSLREEYNDNIHLTTSPHPSVRVTTLTPSLSLNHATEISKVSAGARLSFNNYSGESGLNRTDQYYTLNSNYKTERSIWGLNAGYTKDFASQSDITAAGGQSLRQRSEVSLGPSWTWSMSERNSLKLDYQYSGVKYETGSFFNDYTYGTASASLIHNYSERDQVTVTAYNSKYETANGDVKSDTTGLRGGVSHVFSETLSGSVMVGSYSTQSKVFQASRCVGFLDLSFFGLGSVCTAYSPAVTLESRDNGSSLDASLDKQFETTTLSGHVSRALSPSANGTLAQTDNISFSASDKLTATLTGSLNISATRTRYVGNVITANGARYYSIQPSLSWRMTEWWTLDGGYRYATQAYESGIGDAKSNAVFAQIRYSWPKIAISR